MSHPFRRLAAALLASAALAGAASAYQVAPMTYILAPSGFQSSKRLTVTNTDAGPIDLEIEVFSVSVDDNGKRTFTPADDQFLVFPLQATVKPGASQSFQVRYIGDPSPSTGRIYVVKVHQLNVEYITRELEPGKTSKIALTTNFNTTAVVQPPKAKPALTIVRNLQPDGHGHFSALVNNGGTAVADLSETPWQLVHDGKTDSVPTDKLSYGETAMLAPGASRWLSVNAPLANGAELALPVTR